MVERAVLLIIFAISALVSEPTQPNDADKALQAQSSESGRELVGTWRIISRVVALENGTAVQDPDLGKTPTGYLIYDSSGHMAAQLMKADRSFAIDCGTSAPAPSNNSRSVNGYDAYFGTYTVDQTNHTVTHHLEGALAAADVGKSSYEISKFPATL